MTGYDRASVVARALLTIVAHSNDECECYAQIVACDEFAAIQREVAADLRPH